MSSRLLLLLLLWKQGIVLGARYNYTRLEVPDPGCLDLEASSTHEI